MLDILDEVEKMDKTKPTKQQLNTLVTEYPKTIEHDRSIKAALLNWTSGVAQGLTEAWSRRGPRCVEEVVS